MRPSADDRAVDLSEARAALFAIDPGCSREEWHRAGRAAIAAGLSLDVIDEWSAQADNYAGTRDVMSAFRTVTPDGGTGTGTLFYLARQAGWHRHSSAPRPNPARAAGTRHGAATRPRGPSAAEAWARFAPATDDHPYIIAKKGDPAGLRVVPAGDPLRIAGAPVAGWLAVPVLPLAGGEPVSIQFVPPPGAGKKLNLPGASVAGVFVVGDLAAGGTAYLCEGIGQAWACHAATGAAAVCCFGWGRVRAVAAELRQRDPRARLVLVPDAGKEGDARCIAEALSCAVACMPEGSPANFDANDYAQAGGDLAALLARDEASRHRLRYVVADQIDTKDRVFDDELVERVLGIDSMGMMYGASHTGKTFLMVDLAACVAAGLEWMGHPTRRGVVLYLATEAPSSVMLRVAAWRRLHPDADLAGLLIVQSPINLHAGEADVAQLLHLIAEVESTKGHIALIVVDTMARVAAGANENSGQDMAVILTRAEKMRAAARCALVWIHHSGKDATKGARGWSGLNAAIDAEIEITCDDATGVRAAEITKQRDLGGKGERFGFRLEPVTMGVNSWGRPRTSCTVVPTDAPVKSTRTRESAAAGAIVEFLTQRGTGCTTGAMCKHFEGRIHRATVYREIKRMVAEGTLIQTGPVVTLPGAPGVA